MELEPYKLSFSCVVIPNVMGIGLAKLVGSVELGTNHVDVAKDVLACLLHPSACSNHAGEVMLQESDQIVPSNQFIWELLYIR